MRLRSNIILCAAVAVLALFSTGQVSNAQFRKEAFSQSYNDDTSDQRDTVNKIWSFDEFFGGWSGKREARVGTMFSGSLLFLGGMQFYNKDYWKLPIFYGGMAAGLTSGLILNSQGNTDAAKWCFIGAGVSYWGALMDGTICYKPNNYPVPGKATIYSILVPGLGQIYNHEIWKLPIYWGIMIGGLYYYTDYKRNYERFRWIYNEGDYSIVSKETAKYYKDVYRRYRDYALLAIGIGYLLQIIDANVFAYMHNFDVSDEMALSITPTVLPPANAYAYDGSSSPGLGLSLGFRF